MTPSTKSLWKRYRSRDDSEARQQLLDQHLGLVHYVARRMSARVGSTVELDDLVSSGAFGLVLALESFDPDRGHAFSTYATQRIHGAILDELRSCDWVPRSVRSKRRKVTNAVELLESKLGRHPEPEEIASALDIPLEKYWHWQEDIEGAVLVSFDVGTVQKKSGSTATLEEVVGDSRHPEPTESLTKEEEVVAVRDAIAGLPPKERTVLMLYYYEEMTLRQIADVLHLTESRISQIRSQAVRRLRALFAPK